MKEEQNERTERWIRDRRTFTWNRKCGKPGKKRGMGKRVVGEFHALASDSYFGP
jgi:hypothetical protein